MCVEGGISNGEFEQDSKIRYYDRRRGDRRHR